MRDIDELLEALRGESAHPRLAGLDAAVLAGLATHREREGARRTLAVTSIAALGIGLAASLSAPQSSRAGPSFTLNAVPSAAPSRLLMGPR